MENPRAIYSIILPISLFHHYSWFVVPTANPPIIRLLRKEGTTVCLPFLVLYQNTIVQSELIWSLLGTHSPWEYIASAVQEYCGAEKVK